MPEEIITAPNENAGAAAGKPAGTPEVENEPKEQHVDAPEKKYSDEDLDRILAGKIARERRKLTESISSQLAAELDEREHDILKRELMADAREKLIADRFRLNSLIVSNTRVKRRSTDLILLLLRRSKAPCRLA